MGEKDRLQSPEGPVLWVDWERGARSRGDRRGGEHVVLCGPLLFR